MNILFFFIILSSPNNVNISDFGGNFNKYVTFSPKNSLYYQNDIGSVEVDKESTDKISAAYSRMYSVLYNTAFSRLHDRHIACDLVNDAFVEVLRHRRWWCAQKCSVQEEYLRAACERLCAAYFRKERKLFYVPYDEEKESGADEGGIALAELRQSLDKCLELLEPGERRLIRGKYFENYGTKQLAALIGISEANVLQRLVRARRRLKAILERCGITGELISSE